MTRRKIRVPRESFFNKTLEEDTREYPCLDCLTSKELEQVEKRVNRLMDFESKARVPFQVTDYISNWLSARPGFEEKNIFDEEVSQKQKYFFKDPWEGGSMIIVKEGQLPITEGFHMILCHSDSPCLRLKSRPVRIEWEAEKKFNHLGVRFSAIPHGGISNHQWVAQQVKVIGYHVGENGKKELIEFPGIVGDSSAHVDYRSGEEVENAFSSEKSLEIIAGHINSKEILEKLELNSLDDLSGSKIFAVPVNEPLPIDEYNWRLLVAYGHDDRSVIFSAVDSLVKTSNPQYTSIVWMTDTEETGENAPSGAEGNFIDLVLDKLIEKESEKLNREISEMERRKMLINSSLIIGDVSIAPYGIDSEDMDPISAPKVGFGMFIDAEEGSTSNRKFVQQLRTLAKKGESRGRNICHQVCGSFYNQDRVDLWTYEFTGKDSLLSKIGQWTWAGIPCASCHSHNEIICPGDELWTSRFYKRFFESDICLAK